MSGALNKDPATLRLEAQTDAGLRARQDESARRTAVAQMAEHMLQPATVHTLEIHGARNTRRTFLDPLFDPLVSSTNNYGTTLGDVLAEIETAVGKLDRFEIFRPAPTVHLSDARARDPAAAATDVDIAIRVSELPRFRLNTGTDIGNTEGSAYGNLLWRNIFGGAETLSLNASAGTRTRSAYSASLSAPIEGNPDVRVSLEGLASATQKPWASHEEALKGGAFRIGWRTLQGDLHSLAYGSTWRQITGLAGTTASPAVRRDGGDSLKSALSHTYVRDRRDNALLPSSGYLVRTTSEVAGWGPLGGDVAFAKTEAEFSGAVSSDSLSGVSFGLGLRGGLLYPLPFGYNVLAGEADPSRINDRFILGGPTDVRGFTQGGLGPHDGGDALGGDVFAAGGVNMLVPVTKAGAASPLRLQLFANSGRLVALKGKKSPDADGATAGQVAQSVSAALQELGTGLPSTAVGLGLVYAHPVARFELNFSLPLVMRRGEESRKGLQVGVGINFL
ncbi:sorting assembly machinery 50 kda subunit [Ophiostoma piceae UAMH 11346]|uniref:Sorting assembly machinery 50 kDa subunit n=1 Tax=Ophiostoma piceae (strain UAMH 11346) TaxID=1262450 RepID=S3C713_OPHP1|nr:sorting assembly machinery 50 kda subunit [Ophiostoma piceae UAMH 11346]